MTEPLWEPDTIADEPATPHNSEAERAALGSVFFDLAAIDTLDRTLSTA